MAVSPLVALFLDAVTVDAQSLQEAPMGVFIRRVLAGVPVKILEDGAGSILGGTCGNLICVPASYRSGEPAIALFAHTDTPRTTVGVRPVMKADRISSDGSMVLGVDNRVGVSVLLQFLRDHAATPGLANYIVIFTVGEELGMLGAKHLDLAPYNVQFGFVFDCSKRPGTFIRSAVGCSLYTAVFNGRAAHAGVSPEKGVSAIHVAAKALSRIPMGRLAPQMTSNTGTIAGGTATNVVAEQCTLVGEVRSFDPGAIHEHLGFLEKTFRSVAEENGATLEFRTTVDFEPFILTEGDPVFRRTRDALNAAGLEVNAIEYLGGSDANTLNAKGIPTSNLGIGAQNPHGNDEFVLLEDLHKAVEIARALVTPETIHA